jgi:uroporphyrinogen decarboxylase
MDKLRYVTDAVTSIRKALNGRVPLIGFSGSPWTLACYMVEGKGSDDYRLVKTMLYSRPDLMHRMLQVNADAVAVYLNAQIDAGAQAVMIFDSWGGVLADGAFQAFSLAYTARVLAQLKRTGVDGQIVPRIVFTKGGGLWLGGHEGAGLRGAGPGLDHEPGHGAPACGRRRQAARARRCKATSTPTCCLRRPRPSARKWRACSTASALPHTDRDTSGPTQIFNLGHGISQYTPPENVAVHWWKRCMPTRARSAPEDSVRRLGRGSGPVSTRASRAQNRCRQAFSAGFPEK